MKTNQYSGFHKLTMEQRAQEVAEFAGLTPEELEVAAQVFVLSVKLVSIDKILGEKVEVEEA
jgi:hypothetical protein